MLLQIATALLTGLVLSWFGFDDLIIHGMKEIFGVTISMTGYYFLFAIVGALRSVGVVFNPNHPLFQRQNKK